MSSILSSEYGKAAVALALVWGVYHFVKNPQVRAAALGVGGIVVARQLPFVSDVV